MKKLSKKQRVWLFVISDILFSAIVAPIIMIYSIFYVSNIGAYREYSRQPDDELSHAVREATGRDFGYLGKEESESGITEYEYRIKKLKKDAITDMVNALNDAVENDQGKITVRVYLKIPGGLETVLHLDNFSDDEVETADYDGMYAACIWTPAVADGTCFDHPTIYTGIEGIKKLCIDSEMQQRAEQEGIDWYELWPDLEEVEVIKYDEDTQDDELMCLLPETVRENFEYGGKVEKHSSGLTCYKYRTIDEDKEIIASLVKALNDVLEDEQRKIQVQVDGYDLEFSLENFSGEELKEADYDGMHAIHIVTPEYRSGRVEESDLPLFYTGIEGMRKLYIDSEMQQWAEQGGIDWYELWPDLEEVEVVEYDER